MCETVQSLANGAGSHEEDVCFKAFWKSNLLVRVPMTSLDLGNGLRDFPCFNPKDLISALADRGQLSKVVGAPLDS